MPATHPRKSSQTGAVLIEGLIAASMLVLMFAIIAFVHRVCVAHQDAMQEARLQAWSRAMGGCASGEFGLGSFISGLRDGELPLPGGFTVGQDAEGSGSRSVPALFGEGQRTAAHVVRIPCNTRPPDQNAGSAGEWLLDIF
jgi:hypothetical protein